MEPVLAKNIREANDVFQSLMLSSDGVGRAASAIAKALRAGQKLLACGNGGSAADAAHLTTEFVSRFMMDRRPYPAICFSTHGGDLSALGNDYAFEQVFARQVEAFAQPGDVLISFTTSGQSPNVIQAIQKAKQLGITTISLLGRGGGACRGLADIELLVRSQTAARVQEAHKLLLHTICEIVEGKLGHLHDTTTDAAVSVLT